MMPLFVKGCPFCEMFIQKKVPTELIYPDKRENIDQFIIMLIKNKPVLIVNEHVDSIGKELWGRILYQCKLIYGNNVKLKQSKAMVRDHWHADIIYENMKII